MYIWTLLVRMPHTTLKRESPGSGLVWYGLGEMAAPWDYMRIGFRV